MVCVYVCVWGGGGGWDGGRGSFPLLKQIQKSRSILLDGSRNFGRKKNLAAEFLKAD